MTNDERNPKRECRSAFICSFAYFIGELPDTATRVDMSGGAPASGTAALVWAGAKAPCRRPALRSIRRGRFVIPWDFVIPFRYGNGSLFNPQGPPKNRWGEAGGSWALLRPVWRILQPVQHLTRFCHQQNAFVLAVRKLLDANPGRVAVTEVDSLALLRRDLCGQGDPRARRFDAVFKRAQSVCVGAMREHASGVMLEPVPLLHKALATMVTDFLNHLAVRDANLRNVRRENDEFAAVGQDWFEFVHRFAARPNLVIHLRRAGQDCVERSLLVNDVAFPR